MLGSFRSATAILLRPQRRQRAIFGLPSKPMRRALRGAAPVRPTSVMIELRTLIACAVAGAILCARPASAQEPVPQGSPSVEAKKDTTISVNPGSVKVVNGQGTGGNSWFQSTEQDFGTHFSQDTVVGRFPFTNPNDADIEWRSLQGSCQCSSATIKIGEQLYRYSKKPNPAIRKVIIENGNEREEIVTVIPVPKKVVGEIEVQMELGGVPGPRQATLDLHTTDPMLPMIKLKWSATGAQVFVVTPQEVNLNQMVWNERREFQVTIQSPVQPDFEITGHDDKEKDFTIRYEKVKNDQGVATWTVHGVYQPSSSEALGGGVVKLYTNVPGQTQVTVRVSAAILGPLELKPGTFLTLGMIRKGTKRIEKVFFEPNDNTDIDATSIRIENLTMDSKFVTTRKIKDGKKLIVELEVLDTAPAGLLRGDLVVELNHPAVPSKKILFNGFVR